MARADTSTRRAINLGGLPIDVLDEAGVVTRIVSDADAGQGGWLVNPNVDVLRKVSADDDIKALVADADLLVADGMPLVWASRLRGTPLPERVAGSALIWTLSRGAADAGLGVFLLGGAPGVAARAAERFAEEIPSIDVSWHCPPYGFENNAAATKAIEDALREAAPAIVFCGLGFPKQERLMASLHRTFPHTWFVGSGAAIGFVAGHQSRAPGWMQSAGLEWAHRLAKEPRRLFRRYVVEDMPFALRLLLSAARTRRRRTVAA